jgi:flagellar hook-associated protein 3 FlgL
MVKSMRITSQSLQSDLLAQMRNGLTRLGEAEQSISSGYRIQKPSDDPGAASEVMRISSELRAITQHRRTVSSVQTRLNTQEAVLDQVTDILNRAKELATEQANGTGNAQTRAAAGAEVSNLFDQIVQLGNTRIGNEYLFGGAQTGAPPFQADGTYTGDTAVRQAEIGTNQLVPAGDNGQNLLVTSGVLSSLAALRDQLNANNQDGVGAAGNQIDAAFDQVQTLLAGTGASLRQLDTASQNADALESTLTARQSDLQDVDVSQATVQLASAQNALNAAYIATSRILDTSLTNYLR